MNSLLLVSQLIIPQVPIDFTLGKFVKEAIMTFDCVADAEVDGLVHTLNETKRAEATFARLIVTVKNKGDVARCAKELTSSLAGLKLESTFTIIPAFVVSYNASNPAEQASLACESQGIE